MTRDAVRRVFVSTLFPVLLVAATLHGDGAFGQDQLPSGPAAPVPSFDPELDTFWEIETNLGPITVRLFTDVAPRHAANIVRLARLGTYDGRYFHRVVPGFVAQGGGMAPADSGRSGVGYSIAQERDSGVGHDRAGLVSMVAEEDRSRGSEFFIILAPAPWLDDRNTVFGEVVAGMNTVAAIEAVGSKEGTPSTPVKIERSTIREGPSTLAQVEDAVALLAEGEVAVPGTDGWRARIPAPSPVAFVPGKAYHWHLETEHGAIGIELATDAAPRHVANILYLSALGYYDGLYFNRVIPDFIAQGGGTAPSGPGRAGPPYTLPPERSDALRHDRPWRVSMVAGGNGSVSSQFFITLAATPWLDERNTIIGWVVEGFGALAGIEAQGGADGTLEAPVAITRAWVTEGTFRRPREDPALVDLRGFIRRQRVAGRIDAPREGWHRTVPASPDLAFTRGRSYLWHLETSLGPVTIRFLPDVAPRHVASFLYLSELGFFNGLSFHRVIPEFMAQGGRPPEGGPGYTLPTVTDPNVRHDRAGDLSMANTGRPNSEASEFFITFQATGWLDGRHTIFGSVVDGMETVRELERRGRRDGTPTEPLRIERTWVTVE